MNGLLFLVSFLFFVMNARAEVLPEWYREKKEDTKLYIYGFGSGKSKQEAENSALEYIKRSEKYDNVDIILLNLPSYEIEKYSKIKDNHFVLVNVKRNEFFNQQVSQLDECFENINKFYNFLEDKNVFVKINGYKRILNLAEEIRNRVKIIKLIDEFDDKKYLKFCNKLENEYFKILNGLNVKIVFEDDSLKQLYDSVKINLEKNDRIKVDEKSKNTVVISANVKKNNLIHYNCKALFIVKLLDESDSLINYNSFVYEAKSDAGFENAFRNILKKFEEDLKKLKLNVIEF